MLTTQLQRRAVVALHILALVLLGVLLGVERIGVAPWHVVAFLALSAFVAELLPVQFSRYRIRVTLTLPFVAGMAVAAGPIAALLLDVVTANLASLLGRLREHRRVSRYWLLVNSSTSVVCCSLAGIAATSLVGAEPWPDAWGPIPEVAFTLTYGLLNVGIVLGLRFGGSLRDQAKIDGASIRFALIGTLVYCVVSTAVADVVAKGLFVLLPFLLMPVLMMRAALILKARMMEHYYETIVALMLMLQRAHPYTHGHLERVARMAEQVAVKLGLSVGRARLVREAAVLHDIGKIAIDERILEKPGKLTEEEFEHVRLHPKFGAVILAHCRQFREIVPWILSHHERPDGRGYPMRLSDAEIPIESKIIAVADAYDAMVGGPIQGERRAYREPMSLVAALMELERCAGTQFDPKVVRAFADVIAEGAY